MKVKNRDLIKLQSVYNKLCVLDFELEKEDSSVDLAISIASDYIKIEDSFKAYVKLEKAIQDKAEKQRDDKGNLDLPLIEKANKELSALAEAEVELKDDLNPIPFEIIKKVKLKPLEIKVLKEFKVF